MIYEFPRIYPLPWTSCLVSDDPMTHSNVQYPLTHSN
jgi:hypothetical protein